MIQKPIGHHLKTDGVKNERIWPNELIYLQTYGKKHKDEYCA